MISKYKISVRHEMVYRNAKNIRVRLIPGEYIVPDSIDDVTARLAVSRGIASRHELMADPMAVIPKELIPAKQQKPTASAVPPKLTRKEKRQFKKMREIGVVSETKASLD